MFDLDKLEELAKAATPGPWQFFDEEGECYSSAPATGAFLVEYGASVDQKLLDVNYIAAANPAAVLALIEEVRNGDKPDECVMAHTPPFDFAQCETHDTTFPLGGTCKWRGRESIYEVLDEEAQEQRGRAVRAELERDQALARIAKVEALAYAAVAEHSGRPGATHYESCWKYHAVCFATALKATLTEGESDG